ncbi:hypothetical protein YWH7199_06570 [Fusobacterium nucleatum YWH7199]|nr:hypothetical protein [Fusobacterium nucleatum YWH7199]
MLESNLKMKNNIIYNTVGTFFYFFCQWVITILVVKLGGYSNGGILSITISMTSIFYMISMYGVRSFQVSDIKNKYKDGDYLFLRVVTSIISFVFFGITLIYLDYREEIQLCIIIYMFFKLGESVTDLSFGFFQRYNFYRYIGISYILKGILTLFVFCLTLYFFKNLILTLFLETLGLWFVIIVYDFRKLKNKLNLKMKTYKVVFLLKICFSLMLYTLILPYLNFITRYQIEKFFGTKSLGYYSAITIVIVVISTLFGSIFVIIIPKISYLYKEKNIDEIIKIILKVNLAIFIFTIISIIGAILLGNIVFSVLFTDSIQKYMYLLIPTIITSSILGILNYLSTILISFHDLKFVLIANLIPAIFCTFILKTSIIQYGMLGSLYSLITSLFLGILIVGIRIYFLLKKRKTYAQR